jgi:hypothetical protein
MFRYPRTMTRSNARRSVPTRLALEALEERLPLAGNVTIAFNDGTLTITGDAADNSIAVGMLWGRLVVVPYQSEVNGPTTLWYRGEAVPFVAFDPGHALTIDMRGGSDIVHLGGWQTPRLNFRALTVNLGDGNNSLYGTDIAVEQNVAIRSGNGSDVIVMDALSARGSVNIQAWNGNNIVVLEEPTVGGSLEVIGGLNHDHFQLSAVTSSVLRVRPGEGDSWVTVSGTVRDQLEVQTGAGRDLVILTGMGGGAAIVVHTGAGDDLVSAQDWLPGSRSFTLGLGQGTNEAYLERLAVDGPLSVTGGTGTDRIEVVSTNVLGRLAIDAGEGNNVVTVVQVTALALHVTTAGGADTVEIAFGRFAAEVFIRTGAGADTLGMVGVQSDSIDVDLGDGNDIGSLQWNVFARRTRFAGGAGRDTVRFNRAEHPANYFGGFEVFEQLVVRARG